jgi:predicted nucleic acid-binding protein
VAEVSRRLLREVEAGKEASDQRSRHVDFIRASSQILDVTFDTAIAAGENATEMKKRIAGWGLADSIILVHAREANARVVTGDEHFRKVKEGLFIRD